MGSCDRAMRFANDCLIPPDSASVVLHGASLFLTPGEAMGSSGPIVAGKAAGCTVTSSNSSSKKLQLQFDRLPVPKQLSWIALQWAEDACCAGKGDVSDKSRCRGTEKTVLLQVTLLKSMGPAASQGTVCSDAGCHLPCHGRWFSAWCQLLCARCEYSGCSTWRGCAVDGNHAGLGYKEKQVCPRVRPPQSRYFCLSLCSPRSALHGTLGDQL